MIRKTVNYIASLGKKTLDAVLPESAPKREPTHDEWIDQQIAALRANPPVKAHDPKDRKAVVAAARDLKLRIVRLESMRAPTDFDERYQ